MHIILLIFEFHYIIKIIMSKGKEVVLDAINKVNSVGFPNDHNFLYNIAIVESTFGEHSKTYRDNYFGGIWQVDEIGFNDGKDVISHPSLKKWHKAIKDKLQIDWSVITWKDCVNPINSAIAARLLLVTKPGAIPTGLNDQAVYWKNEYNKSEKGTFQVFIDRINNFNSKN